MTVSSANPESSTGPISARCLQSSPPMAGPHVGVALQQQVGQHCRLLGFFSKKLSKTEVNYSTFDRELLAAVSGIKHLCSRLEGHPFQLWTNHKPLIFALNRVSPPTSGRQQRHLAFSSEYTSLCMYQVRLTLWRMSCPAWRGLPPGPPGPAQPSPTGRPWISRIWPSARSSAPRYKLSAPAQGCASSHRRSATLTSSATHPRHLPPTGAQGPSATDFRTFPRNRPPWLARDPPPHFLQVCVERSLHRCHRLGEGLPGLPAGQGSTTMYRYLFNTSRNPPAVSATSTWTWWAPCWHPKVLPTCSSSLTEPPVGPRR
jgi:hypothetical protein